MKKILIRLLALFVTLFSASWLNAADDICYDPPKQEGISILGIGLFYGVETPIRNISRTTLKNVTIIKSFNGINIELLSGLKLDGTDKTPARDNDNAQTSSLLSASIDNIGVLDGIFSQGIIYGLDQNNGGKLTFNSNQTHTIYDKSTLAINWSKVALNARYTKGSTEYNVKINPCQDYSNNNERDFALVESHNIRGDIQTIGNSMLLRSDGACAPNSTNNNDINPTWADRDGNSSTFNSSSADLTLPKGVGKDQILYAAFYWQGRANGNKNSSHKPSFWDKAKQAKFKAPNLDYKTLTAPDYAFNWTKRSSDTNYQGIVEVTDILKQSIGKTPQATIDSSGFSGTFWGADIQADKIQNGFGAWSLVIIYEDKTKTLKNISLYDGYISVNNGNTKTTTLNGFLTPTKGDVNSKFLLFGGEGDITLTDSVSLSNSSGDQSLGNNIFKSAITIDGDQVTNRNPNCQNTIGIDLHTFDIGTNGKTAKIMKNSQTSTNIKLKSTGDVYYPGMFAFTTELYVPDVCYVEDLFFKGAKISESNLPQKDDVVDYEVLITNKNNEPAKGIYIEKVFDKPNEITYKPSSLKIREIGASTFNPKTDASGDDTAQYSADTIKLLLGAGASASSGGTIEKDKETSFRYSAIVGDNNASENTYKVSYRNDTLGVNFYGTPIRKCSDFNNSFGVYVPIIGNFNTIRKGGLGGGTTVPLDANDPINALYTQIARESFMVDVVSLGNDNITASKVSKDTTITLSIVELDSDGNCTNNNISDSQTLNFTKNGSYIQTATVTPNKASRNAAFHMVGEGIDLCSRDRFAVRPATYSITSPIPKMVGAKLYNIDFKANDNSNNNSLGYTQSLDNSSPKKYATVKLVVPTGCDLNTSEENVTSAIPFVDGAVSAGFKYDNIGDIELKLSDSEWTHVDSDGNKGDCIVDSNSTTPNADGKVGCDIRSTKKLTFIPAKFKNNLTLSNSANGYTYISSDNNVSANINVTTTAWLDNNTTATNYTKNCFAKEVTTNLKLENSKDLTWKTTQERIKFYDDSNTSTLQSQSGASGEFKTAESVFTDGIANITYKFNFDRDALRPDNPFQISANDFNITSTEDADVHDSITSISNSNATFIYGRANAAKQRYKSESGVTNIYFEAFCFGTECDKALLPDANNSKNGSDLRWFKNTKHQNPSDGKINSVEQKDGSIVAATTPTNTNPSQTTLTYDKSKGYPYKTTMKLNTSPHLENGDSNTTLNNFDVEFSNKGLWSGKHDTNSTTDTNQAIKTNRRIMW